MYGRFVGFEGLACSHSFLENHKVQVSIQALGAGKHEVPAVSVRRGEVVAESASKPKSLWLFKAAPTTSI